MLEELNEEEGPTSSDCVKACRPMMSRVVIRQQCTALLVKGGSMYDASFFFVPNPINRYTLSARNKFVTNPDGSIDLYLQADSPGEAKEANWLPTPKAKFIPMLRLYWPKETPPSILDGTWKPAAIKVAQ